MTVTRADVEVILVKRIGLLFEAADLNGTTVDGTNVDMNDPIGYALRRLGYAVASAVLVADSDLSGLVDDDLNAFLDLAELRCLETFLGNFDDVNIKLGPRSESFSDLRVQAERRANRLRSSIARQYGLEDVSIDVGALRYDFAEHFDNEPEY